MNCWFLHFFFQSFCCIFIARLHDSIPGNVFLLLTLTFSSHLSINKHPRYKFFLHTSLIPKPHNYPISLFSIFSYSLSSESLTLQFSKRLYNSILYILDALIYRNQQILAQILTYHLILSIRKTNHCCPGQSHLYFTKNCEPSVTKNLWHKPDSKLAIFFSLYNLGYTILRQKTITKYVLL